ncbi:CRTAC1 family protein [Nocardia sp. NBC_00565]|uniref:CRTAC1 family protein n=1 Tax=Nocardia sp. NBC_00565 TaxID=2975993 RepID=UPI002E81139B|nr:CRTAC1 family protein [Nocardia sp. NBC_00565]WUC00237.1 CRTAC1 family protein [Nocardia sp. NBC_00565]
MASLTLMAVLFVPAHSAMIAPVETDANSSLASRFHFTEMPIALPPGLPEHKIRHIEPRYEHIVAWLSSVNAATAINDIDGNGRADDLCLVDSRSDTVIVTPTPDSDTSRYAPFVLDPAPLPTDDRMAPTGCVPGDFDHSGRIGLMVYYGGRTPVLFLPRAGARHLDNKAFKPVEMVEPPATKDGSYQGARWFTLAASVADFDGDGNPDVYLGNYFPDSDFIGPDGAHSLTLNESFSTATNAGTSRLLTFQQSSGGAEPNAVYREVVDALPEGKYNGWTLATATQDLTGDQLPELYVANDMGKDRLFVNKSTAGHIKFDLAEGERGPTDPKSSVLGHDSFKGMGADFGDLDGDGMPDLFVSNIAQRWGILESNLAFYNTAADPKQAADELNSGVAPFKNRAVAQGVAWDGWGWDTKIADFDNSGRPQIVQTNGMFKGKNTRWPQVQELATMNDDFTKYPWAWPKFTEESDLAGNNRIGFLAQDDSGKFTNISPALDIFAPTPTRGIAVGDPTGTGALSFAVARQWEAPVYYRNDAPHRGQYLGLRLFTAPTTAGPGDTTVAGRPVLGSPALGAEVTVPTPDGKPHIAQVDGGSGHAGKRSTDIHIGLGDIDPTIPLAVQIAWRDNHGAVHTQQVQLQAGQHTFVLDSDAREVHQ